MALEIEFVRERVTKNTVRFAEVVEDGYRERVGSLYVSKHALELFGNPVRLRVTIEPAGTPQHELTGGTDG